jgi:hypothetical protein
MVIPLQDDELIPDDDLAVQWGCTRRTLGRYDQEPDGLPYVYVGGKKYRPVKACQAWLAKRVRRPNPRRGAA